VPHTAWACCPGDGSQSPVPQQRQRARAVPEERQRRGLQTAITFRTAGATLEIHPAFPVTTSPQATRRPRASYAPAQKAAGGSGSGGIPWRSALKTGIASFHEQARHSALGYKPPCCWNGRTIVTTVLRSQPWDLADFPHHPETPWSHVGVLGESPLRRSHRCHSPLVVRSWLISA
jgi:hypothetical protein